MVVLSTINSRLFVDGKCNGCGHGVDNPRTRICTCHCHDDIEVPGSQPGGRGSNVSRSYNVNVGGADNMGNHMPAGSD